MILVIAGAFIQARELIQQYSEQQVKRIEEFKHANIYNSNGSYMILYNPSEVREKSNASKEGQQTNQKSILVTVPFDLKGARYFILDDYYTKIDYNLATVDGNTVTEINLYNPKRQEKITLKYSTTGKGLSSNDSMQPISIKEEEIPEETPIQMLSPNENKLSLSKGSSYVEIPNYFSVEEGDYSYRPVDFIQFTNIFEE